MSKIYQIYGQDAHDMTRKLLEAIQAIHLVPSGGSVALKPNLVVADVPEGGAVTHPGVLSGCIEYFRANGVQDISVIEGSWVGDETMRAMRRAGYDKVCKEYGVPFHDLKKDATRSIKTAVGAMDICCRALDAGLLVDLPVLKGHCQTLMTCALKNLKGCIPDKEKRRFHSMGLHKPIAALAGVLRPGLIIVDSICGDLNFEEGGNPVQTNRMYAGTDPVQLDAYGASLMGLPLEDVPYITMAQRCGAGKTDFSPERDVVALNHPSDAAAYAKPGGMVAKLTRNVHQDQACSACFANLVRALYAAGEPSEPISIGQGFRGKAIEGLGIGACCAGAERCVMGCPPSADAIVRAFGE